MEVTNHRLNLSQIEPGQDLVDIIRRDHPADVWYVPFSPLDFQRAPAWRHYKRDQHVAIPLFGYRVTDSPLDAMGYAFQLGIRAMHDLGGKPIKRFHLSLGDPIQQINETGSPEWLFYMGFGVVLL